MRRITVALLASTALIISPANAVTLPPAADGATSPAPYAPSGFGIKAFGGVPGLAYSDPFNPTPQGAPTWRPVPVAYPMGVSLLAFGAIPNVNSASAAAANVAAMTAAYAMSTDVYCPGGQTFYTTGETLPANARRLFGACTFSLASNASNGANVIRGSGHTGLRIDDVTASADLVAFPGANGFNFSGETRLLLNHVSATAGFGIVDIGSTSTEIDSAYVGDYNTIGILAQSETGIKIDKPEVHASKNTTSHCIQIGGTNSAPSSFGTVSNGSVYKCGRGFGVSIAGTAQAQAAYMNVLGVHAYGTRIEGINFTDAREFTAVANEVSFDGDTTDFGISANSDPAPASSYSGLITGNKVNGSCKAGTALATNIIDVAVVGNTYTNVGACIGRQASFTGSVSAAGVLTVTSVGSGSIGWYDTVTGSGVPSSDTIQPYGTNGTTGTGGTGTYQLATAPSATVASESMTSAFSDPLHSNVAVLVYGTSNGNTVGPNNVADLYNPQHLIYDEAELSNGGTPNNDTFTPATGSVGTSGNINIVGTLSTVVGAPPLFTTFTPTLSCDSGAPGSTSSASGSFQRFGKLVSYNVAITLADPGTCSGALHYTLPPSALPAQTTTITQRENAKTGVPVQSVAGGGSSNAYIVGTNNSALSYQAGMQFNFHDTYQSQ